jgi:hypothetical protein
MSERRKPRAIKVFGKGVRGKNLSSERFSPDFPLISAFALHLAVLNYLKKIEDNSRNIVHVSGMQEALLQLGCGYRIFQESTPGSVEKYSIEGRAGIRVRLIVGGTCRF